MSTATKFTSSRAKNSKTKAFRRPRRQHLTPGRGVAALLDGEQVAVFLLGYPDGSADLRAVGNIDPFARAAVISRGLVGARGPVPTVASPLLKQVFSLDTGECLDDSSHALPVYPIRVRAGVVEVTRWADAA